MYSWLSEAVDNNGVVITASRRLARVLRSEYGRQRLADGNKAWLTPNIRSLDGWLVSTLNAATDALPTLLSPHASNFVWERCLKERAGNQLLSGAGLIKQARRSWQRLHDWRVALDEVSRTAHSQDERLFASAARNYGSTLAHNNWMDDAQVTGVFADLVKKGTIPVPGALVIAGFDRMVPAVVHLSAVMSAKGCSVTCISPDSSADDVAVCEFDNEDAELRAAGAWARTELSENPSATIGIVCSTLDKHAAAAERLVREGVAPGWQYGGTDLQTAVDISYGRPLSDYPAIGVALLALQWLHRGLSFAEISLLLRTQFMAGQHTVERCRLELQLRRLPDQPWSPSAILRLFRGQDVAADAARWLRAIEALGKFQERATALASPAAWADRIDRLMREIDWPGVTTLASDEFQLVNRWRELLNDLARLEVVCPRMKFAEASARLSALANDTLFQAETEACAVHVLGPLEAAGLQFDQLWVAGFDADTWPPAAHPLTLISRELQRQHSMPDAKPQDTLDYAQRVIDRLLSSARRIRISWSRTTEGSENTISPLVAGFTVADTLQASDPGWHATTLIGTGHLERPAEDPAPAADEGELLAGGAYTVQRQVTDPFSAFAFGRLRVAELDSVNTGLSPALRGKVIHTALHNLYAEGPSQADIRRWSDDDRQARIERAADKALNRFLWYADPILRRILELERARLCDLLTRFIDNELQRPEFQVAGVEREFEFQQSGVRLNLRVDRIDRLEDNTLLIADYKSGTPKNLLDRHGNLKDLQLAVYASAVNEPVGALVLINIDSRSIGYDGTGGGPEWGASRCNQWAQRLVAWQENVTRAMQQIAAGDARVNISLGDEETRPLSILSRVEEGRREQ